MPRGQGINLKRAEGDSLRRGQGINLRAFSRQIWKSAGDQVNRKFEYNYDAMSRILKADFSDSKSYDFSMKIGDGNNSQTGYDANGGIQSMKQRGLKGGANTTIDSLTYNYVSNSNKLNLVTDANNDEQSTLGDFHYTSSSKTSQDYTYDGNGNLFSDRNKGIDSIIYNELNLPKTIYIKNKGTIFYNYDASGLKIGKVIADSSIAGKTVTTTTNYIGGFVYQSKLTTPNADVSDYSDSLQLVSQEEGRIRKLDTGTFVYDYFIKDHLENVRMVLTEQKDTIKFPSATLESSTLATEKNFFSINDGQIVDTSFVNGARNYPQLQTKVYRINGGSDVSKSGLGIVLKVMAGDKVSFSAQSIYTATGTLSNPTTATITDLLSSFLGSAAMTGKGLTAAGLDALSPGSLTAFQNQHSESSNRPKAYLNYLLFDDQFRYVTGDLDPVNTCTVNTPSYRLHDKFISSPINVSKSGYIYIYVSNESNLNVFFDNLTVTHMPGPIVEENHYYPFGLIMQGISSQKVNGIRNFRKFNGGSELCQDLGFNLYETSYRNLDPQLGRFNQMDMMADKNADFNPYSFVQNNPILFFDPQGLDTVRVTGEGAHKIRISKGDVLAWKIGEKTSYFTYDPKNSGAVNGFISGGIDEGTMQGVTVTPAPKANFSASYALFTSGQIAWAAGTTFSAGEELNATFRLTTGRNAGNVFSPKWYGSGWNGGSRAAIRTFKIAKVARVANWGLLGIVTVMDGIGVYKYYRSPNTDPNAFIQPVHPAKAGLNLGMGLYGMWVNPVLPTLYFGVDAFYPGGWVGYGKDYDRYQKENEAILGPRFITAPYGSQKF